MSRRPAALIAAVMVASTLLAVTSPAEAAARNRSATLTLSASSVTAGSTVGWSGRATSTGRNVTVELQRKSGSRWKKLTSTRTDSKGRFAGKLKASTIGRSSLRASIRKTSRLRTATSPARTLTTLRTSSATLTVSDATPTTTDAVTFSGSVTPFRAGTAVRLQRRIDTAWKDEGSASTVDSRGGYRFDRTALAGTWSYRVVTSATSTYIASATSPTVDVDAAGPASLQVQVLNAPSGSNPVVTVTDPDGAKRTVSSTTTIPRAKPGTWVVQGAPLAAGGSKLWPVAPRLETIVGRSQSAVVVMDYKALVPDSTATVPAREVSSVTTGESGTAVTFDESAPVKTGDTLALGVGEKTPYGLLGKVTSTDGRTAVVDTTDTSLLDAVSEGLADVSTDLGSGDVVDPGEGDDVTPIKMPAARGLVSRPSRAMAAAAATSNESLSRRLKKGFSCTGGASASLDSELSLTTGVQFSANWDLFAGLTSARATASVSQSAAVGATLEAKGSCELKRTALLTKPIEFRPITFAVGPVPVVIVPTLQFFVDGKGSFRATLSAGVKQSFSATAGVEYTKDGGFGPVQSISQKFEKTDPTFTGKADAEAGVAPELWMLFYGLGGPRAYIRAGLAADAHAAADAQTASLDWNVDLKVKAAAALDVDTLKLHSGELTLFDRTFDLIDGRVAYTPPPAPEITTTTLPDGTVGTPYTQRLRTADDRPGTWSISSGSLPAGLRLSGDTITGTPSTQRASRFSVQFDDGDGRATISLRLNVAPGGSDPDADKRWNAVSGGWGYACGLRGSGSLYCWGNNTYYRLGIGTENWAFINPNPVAVGTASDWTTVVAMGDYYTCGLRGGGELYCWGINDSGQLGTGDTELRSKPARVGDADDWTSLVATAERSACALRGGGELYCWGTNEAGQLGTGDKQPRTSPARVGSFSDWKSVTASFGAGSGSRSVCGVRERGELYCWGDNNHGQLGIGRASNSLVPQRVGASADWTSIATTGQSTCGLRDGGELYCWGNNESAQLGTGDTVRRYTPERVGTASDWTWVDVFGNWTCGLRGTGELYCWGANSYGQLGTGDYTWTSSPTRIGNFDNWSAIASGYESTCGTRGSGELYCWGNNEHGELGTGDTRARPAPTRVGSAEDWTLLVKAGYSPCGSRVGGELFCWGSNEYGQLGVGDDRNRNTPTPVTEPSNAGS